MIGATGWILDGSSRTRVPRLRQPRAPVSPVLAVRVVSQPPYAAADGAGIDNVNRQRSRRWHGPRRAHIRWRDRLPPAKPSRSTALPLSHLAWPGSCLAASQPTRKAGCNGWKTDEIREPGRVELPSTRVVRLIRAALPARCRDFVPEGPVHPLGRRDTGSTNDPPMAAPPRRPASLRRPSRARFQDADEPPGPAQAFRPCNVRPGAQ